MKKIFIILLVMLIIPIVSTTLELNYPKSIIDYAQLNKDINFQYSIYGFNISQTWYNYNGTNITPSYTELIGTPNTTIYFSFEETSGSTVIDRTGNGNNGTIIGNISKDAIGIIDKAYNFTGEGYVNMSNTDFDYQEGGFSYSAWVRVYANRSLMNFLEIRDSTQRDGINPTGFIVIWRGDYSSPRLEYQFYSGGFTSPSRSDLGGNFLANGSLHHIAFVFNYSGQKSMKSYLNGVLSVNLEGGDLDEDNLWRFDELAYLILGARYNDANKWNGTIDEFSLYNKPLSASEVIDLYNLGSAKRPQKYYVNDSINLSTSKSAIVYANDTTGNLETQVFSWDYKIFENSREFNSESFETKLETYSINLNYDSSKYLIINANLIYNNTPYSSTRTGSGNNAIFTKNLEIPIYNSDVNNSFYWSISITDTSGTEVVNTTTDHQYVKEISMGICNLTINITTLNFTAYSEKTLERLYNLTLKGNFEYFIGSSTTPKTFEFSNLSTSELDFCISNHVNYTISGLIQASLDSYNPTEYNFINFIVNNQTQKYYLYLLNISITTPFIIKIQGQNQLPLKDYYVYIYRYDSGSSTPNLVQAVKTDSLGQTIGLFETYTIDYKFLVYDDDGNLVYTSEKMKIIPTTTPYTLTFTVGSILPSPTEYFDNLTGMTWTLGYNKNTYLASLSYSDSNSSFIYGNFIVKGLNMSGGDKVICNLTSSNPSAVLVCDLTGNLSGGYVAEFYVNRGSLIYVDSLVFSIKTISQIVGMLGVLGAFFIILFASFAFFTNEIAGILSVNFAVFICEVFGLINIGLVGMSAIIGISILIIVVLVRNQ